MVSLYTRNVNPVREGRKKDCFYASTVYTVNSSIKCAVAEHLPKWPHPIPMEAIRKKKICDL